MKNIDGLIDNELSDAEEAECRAHLQSCAACATAHDERRDLKQLISSRAARPSLPPRLENRIRMATRHRSHNRRRRRVQAAAALILAGCIVLLTISQMGDRRLTHASASSECARAFERTLTERSADPASVNRDTWEGQIRQVLKDELGIQVTHLPQIHAATFRRWQREEIRGVRGLRLDFRPHEASSERNENAMISLFLLPLQHVTLDPKERDALASFHFCLCTQWTGGSIFCYTEGDLLVSVVGNIHPKRLRKHVTGS